jgi:ATP-dependent RNA helicase DeaD
LSTFKELNLPQELCEVLRKHGIKEPMPVQEKAIPAVRSGQDAIVQSQTGTGKTLAFLLPIMEKIKVNAPVAQALVVTPTRELAQQIAKVASMLGEAVGVKGLVIYGGQDIERQKLKLGRHPQLIIGTPGRLLDHLRRHTINLSQVNRIVLDEADEMLRRGFLEDVETLLQAAAGDHQLMMFSATMPDRVKGLASHFMERPVEIAIEPEKITIDSIEQIIVDTTEETKLDTLCELINKYHPYLAMVFCHTKRRVGQVMMGLAQRGYLVDELHGDLTQTQRTRVLNQFRTAKLQILVTTDIAARGLDIEGVTHIFNYDIPQDAEWYIHRIGRTGRAGEKGMAITFVNARQYEKLRHIETDIKNHITKQSSGRRHQKAKKADFQPAEDKGSQKRNEKKPWTPQDRRLKKTKHSNPHAQKPKARLHTKNKSNMGHRSRFGHH